MVYLYYAGREISGLYTLKSKVSTACAIPYGSRIAGSTLALSEVDSTEEFYHNLHCSVFLFLLNLFGLVLYSSS